MPFWNAYSRLDTWELTANGGRWHPRQEERSVIAPGKSTRYLFAEARPVNPSTHEGQRQDLCTWLDKGRQAPARRNHSHDQYFLRNILGISSWHGCLWWQAHLSFRLRMHAIVTWWTRWQLGPRLQDPWLAPPLLFPPVLWQSLLLCSFPVSFFSHFSFKLSLVLVKNSTLM